MTKNYYVYLHRKKTTGEVFYVGKGFGSRAYLSRNRSSWWKQVVNKHGYTIEIVKDNLQEWYALELEIDLISYYGRRDLGKGTLVNLTDGGDGSSGFKHTLYTKIKMSEIRKGKIVSSETRVKISEYFKGKPKSEKEKYNLSISKDDKTYKFLHESGISFTGKRYDFFLKYGFTLNTLFKSGNRNTCKGWTLLDEYIKPKFGVDHSVYRFTHKTGEVFIGTRIEFKSKYQTDVSFLFTPHYYNVSNDWTLKDEYIKPKNTNDEDVYEFVHKDGSSFTGSRSEFKQKYGVLIKPLFLSSPAKSCHGWSLAS